MKLTHGLYTPPRLPGRSWWRVRLTGACELLASPCFCLDKGAFYDSGRSNWERNESGQTIVSCLLKGVGWSETLDAFCGTGGGELETVVRELDKGAACTGLFCREEELYTTCDGDAFSRRGLDRLGSTLCWARILGKITRCLCQWRRRNAIKSVGFYIIVFPPMTR